MTGRLKETGKMPDRTNNVGMAIASSISFEEAMDLDLTDMMVNRLNTGASIQQLQAEINAGIEDRQNKLRRLKVVLSEQLETALRISLEEEEEVNKHDLGDPRF